MRRIRVSILRRSRADFCKSSSFLLGFVGEEKKDRALFLYSPLGAARKFFGSKFERNRARFFGDPFQKAPHQKARSFFNLQAAGFILHKATFLFRRDFGCGKGLFCTGVLEKEAALFSSCLLVKPSSLGVKVVVFVGTKKPPFTRVFGLEMCEKWCLLSMECWIGGCSFSGSSSRLCWYKEASFQREFKSEALEKVTSFHLGIRNV